MGSRRNVWECQCDCGNKHFVPASYLKWESVRSCGCLKIDKTTKHGLFAGTGAGHENMGQSRRKIYSAWVSMKDRCTNPKNRIYRRYGGRGITVCDKWMNDFGAFWKDMGSPPTKHHSLDRKHNDDNYTPDNCRWATRRQQNQNRSIARLVTINGVTKNLCEWSRLSGVDASCIAKRITKGWPESKWLVQSWPGKPCDTR